MSLQPNDRLIDPFSPRSKKCHHTPWLRSSQSLQSAVLWQSSYDLYAAAPTLSALSAAQTTRSAKMANARGQRPPLRRLKGGTRLTAKCLQIGTMCGMTPTLLYIFLRNPCYLKNARTSATTNMSGCLRKKPASCVTPEKKVCTGAHITKHHIPTRVSAKTPRRYRLFLLFEMQAPFESSVGTPSSFEAYAYPV